MEEKTFSIPKISCGHCVMAIKNELGEMEGVASVEGNPEKKQITVRWKDPANEASIKEALAAIDYPAAG